MQIMEGFYMSIYVTYIMENYLDTQEPFSSSKVLNIIDINLIVPTYYYLKNMCTLIKIKYFCRQNAEDWNKQLYN